MEKYIKERTLKIGKECVETGATVRVLAMSNGISKSTVHKDLTERLGMLDEALYEEVREVLKWNKLQRARRGGMATKQKYEELKKLQAKEEG